MSDLHEQRLIAASRMVHERDMALGRPQVFTTPTVTEQQLATVHEQLDRVVRPKPKAEPVWIPTAYWSKDDREDAARRARRMWAERCETAVQRETAAMASAAEVTTR